MKDSRILVIGGSSGIGLEVARLSAAAGAEVVIASRNADRLAAAQAELPGLATLVLDIADEDACRTVLATTQPWDHVVVSAGGAAPGMIRGRSQTKARRGFDGKFWGAWSVAANARLTDKASLTFISGIFAARPQAGNLAASCVNAAVEALAKGLAVELAPIRANAVSPGYVDTPLWAAMPAEQRDAMFAQAAARLPSGRITTSREIAETVLLCMRNPTLTGTVLTVDGGYSLA
nr:SDR family oxidoreductase [Sphingobium sp. JAI105]